MKQYIYGLMFLVLLLGATAHDMDRDKGGSGAIWTTDEGCSEPQNDNHYAIGDDVWIRGENFKPGKYVWSIMGQPGEASCTPKEIVDGGLFTVDSSGSFCFNAHTVDSIECGEYKVEFGKKHDNYRVDKLHEDDHQVPEFSTLSAGVAIIGAGAVALFKRR